jgi:hypothetical protein
MQNKKNLPHPEWVKYQFNVALRPHFRDVLIHTSFIEAIVRIEADPKNQGKILFGKAINIMFVLRERCNLYLDGKLDEIKTLWGLRNEIAHEILTSELKEEEIIQRIYNMFNLIKIIYRESVFIQNFFNKYGLKTDEIIRKLEDLSMLLTPDT